MTGNSVPDATETEVRALLDSVLRAAAFPGRDDLLRQVAGVRVTGGPVTMLDLSVEGVPACQVCADGPAPLSAAVRDAAGTSIGELLVWVRGGYLTGLEFAWWSDDAPRALPFPDQVTVSSSS